jgi:lipid-binding SYLF domain-containing protein
MNKRRAAILLLAQIVLGLLSGAAPPADVPALAPTAAEINRDVNTALNQLYEHNEAARALGAKAKAVLVFPSIKKAAFIVGAQYGYGALRRGRKTVGYFERVRLPTVSKPA